MNPEIFIELSLILIITVIITSVMQLLKQPAIIGYIISGIIAGPSVLNIIGATHTFEVFSHIGVALLLFFVGINLDPKVIRDVGKIAFITGLGQVLFTSSIGFLILKLIGFSTIASIYASIALAFSSTIIIMKLLSDKKDLDTLYGKISVGFLIVQDFIAIAILIIVSSLNTETSIANLITMSIIKGSAGIALIIGLTKFVLPKLTEFTSKSQEFLLLFSIGWCFAISTAFYYLGFSIEIGALLSGMALSTSKFHYEISAKLKPIRDFFLVLFFIMLGSQMVFANIMDNIWIVVLLSLFVLIGNPIILMTLMGFFGYTKRNSFLAGLTVAQISEFSLIVISMGVTIGHVSNEILSVITAVGLITFAGSSYMIMYSNKLYHMLSKYLNIFEKKGKKVDEHKYHTEENYDVILIGYNRVGFDILEHLEKTKKKILVVDYDPNVIKQLHKKGIHCRYGDADDIEMLNDLSFEKTKMVISTIPELDTNMLITEKAKDENENVIVCVVSSKIEDAVKLYDEGATYVLMPHFLGGIHFSNLLKKHKLNIDKFTKEKLAHLEYLNFRKELGLRNKSKLQE